VPDLNARFSRIAVLGGVYSNYLALEAVLADARAAGAQAIFCLGDIGAFGPHPDRAVDLLRGSEVHTLQGNYDDSVGNSLDDCQCGYTDPRDNHYAQQSYDYTLANTRADNRAWLRDLPPWFRCRLGQARVLMSHGSPRRVNEFLWQSTTPEPFIRRLLGEHDADLILCTHTGLPWHRFTDDAPGRRGLVNVGAIGRPANDGDPRVCYDLLEAEPHGRIRIETRKVAYDHARLAAEMRAEGLPEEFVETIVTGWWTTCLEILPARERQAGRH
jgi:diadenosine tetraphosphatase ApaH/serine/threonine PP2A family protein phosphatase